MAAHAVSSARPMERTTAGTGRATKARAAAGGPIMRLKISSAPTTGTVTVVAAATTSRKAISMRRAADAPCLGDVGHRRGEQQGPVEQCDRGDARGAHGEDRHQLGGADTEDLAEEERVDLRFVAAAEAQEERAQGEHHDQRQGGRDVAPAAGAEGADAERGQRGEHAQARRAC